MNSLQRSFRAGLAALILGTFLAFSAQPAVAGTNPAPDLSLSLPIGASPWDVKEGPDGRLYVSDSAHATVLVYPVDATATTEPLAVLNLKTAALVPIQSMGLTFAPDNRLFVASGDEGIVYSFASTDVIGVVGVHDIVASSTTFVINGTVLSVTFHGSYMFAFAFDSDEIYVYDMVSNQLYMFLQSTNGLRSPTAGVVLDGYLIVSNNHGVADGSGMISWLPLSQIEGHGQVGGAPGVNVMSTKTVDSTASLSNFTDYLTLDCNDNIIVTNYGGYPQPINVNKFSPDSTQFSAPITSITSDNLELATSEGVDVDSVDRVWVAQTSGAVLRFDSFADACPLAAGLPNTGLSEPASTEWAAAAIAFTVLGIALAFVRRNRRVGRR